MMIILNSFCSDLLNSFPDLQYELPWRITAEAESILFAKIKTLGSDFSVCNNIAIHRDAQVENHVTLKGPVIISAGCFIAAHAYLRGGVYLGEKVCIGPGCEVKSSFIMPHTTLAHFNFAGESIIGSHTNMEAGSIIANHYNERQNKLIDIMAGGKKIPTHTTKFGALVGDHSKIGANAVLSPGTILLPNSIINRLQLIEQG